MSTHERTALPLAPAVAHASAAAGPIPPLAPTGPHADARGEGTTPRRYTIEIPPRTILLNANDRHDRYKRARIVKNLRTITHQLAVIRRIPRLERAVITGLVHPPDNRDRDPHNWYPTYKACVDGAVDAGVLAKDSAEFLVGSDMQLGEKARVLSFSLLIREVL